MRMTLQSIFCSCVQPQYFPNDDDESEFIWSSKSYLQRKEPQSSVSPSSQILNAPLQPQPLRRTVGSISTQTTATMNTNSFEGCDWSDDEDDDIYYNRASSPKFHIIPPLTLSRDIACGDDESRCGPISCSYASTALIRNGGGDYECDDDDTDSLIDESVQESSSRGSRSSYPGVESFLRRQRDLPQAWSW